MKEKVALQNSPAFTVLSALVRTIDYSKLIESRFLNEDSIEMLQNEFYTKLSTNIYEEYDKERFLTTMEDSKVFQYLYEIPNVDVMDQVYELREDIVKLFRLWQITDSMNYYVSSFDECLFFIVTDHEEYTEIL